MRYALLTLFAAGLGAQDAPMPHLLGLDHMRLAYRHNGIDRRITDVFGEVIREII